MTAPEQQPNNPVETNGGTAAGPDTSGAAPAGRPVPPSSEPTGQVPQPQSQSPSSDSQPQPAYGQYANLDYGAMRSQFGPNYNPYLYGAPDPDPKQSGGNGANANGQSAPAAAPNAAYNPYGYPGAQGRPVNPYGGANPGNGPANAPANPYPGPNGPYPTQPYGGANGARNDGHTPRYIYGIDVNDPNQNPLYGRWDAYAIIAFVFALIFSVPLLPAVMGAASLWRTRTFHMKGRGFAIAAIVINLITTGVQVWMWLNGISVSDLYADLLNMYGMDGGSGSSSGDSMSA